MPYCVPLQKIADSKELSTKGKLYFKFSGVNQKKCKNCKKMYYPIRIDEKGFEQNRCVDCYTDILFDSATKTLDQF